MSNNLYTRQAVADYIGVSRMTISRWEKLKPISYTGGHLWRIDKSHIREWFKEVMGIKEKKDRFYLRPRTGILND